MTASYWEIGRRIVEFEQGGDERAGYGEVLVERLSRDLTQRFGRGFGRANLWSMRAFYLAWPADRILQTASGESAGEPILQTVSAELPEAVISESLARKSPDLTTLAARFPLPWSAYVRLLSVKNAAARSFYETESKGGDDV